jgi:cellulose biosynthesis protein BcsQ
LEKSEHLLRGSAVAFVNFKGGSMKSTLAATAATLASEKEGWKTVVVDLDSSAPLTRSVFYQGESYAERDVLEGLRRVSNHEQVDDLLLPAPALGNNVYVLPGFGRGAIPKDLLAPKKIGGSETPASYEAYIPELIAELLNCYVDGEPVDLVVVDCPGENEKVNEHVLLGVDFVAMPASFTATDITASKRTIGLINIIQRERKGGPVFLGFIPTFISRGAEIDRAVITAGAENLVVDMVLSGMLLPFIPASEDLRKTFAKRSAEGIVTVPGFAMNRPAGQRVLALWEAMNNPRPEREKYLEELLSYLSITTEDFRASAGEVSVAG